MRNLVKIFFRLNRITGMMLFFAALGPIFLAFGEIVKPTVSAEAPFEESIIYNLLYLWELFFPAFLLFLIGLPAGLNLAAVLLMLMGTQWYLLFNVIAGATAIPQDLRYTTTMLQLNGWQRWRTLILPALFPYIVTGAITASGGAWNASIVAEHVIFNGKTYNVTGIGSVIAQATASGNYGLLLAGTLTMVFAVVLLNRLVWRRLYELAENQYRLE